MTGATGRVGFPLVEALRAKGYPVVAFVRANTKKTARLHKLRELGAEIFSGDLADPGEIHEAAKGAEVIFHAGALMSDNPSERNRLFDVNAKAIFHLLEAALSGRRRIHRIINFSSTAVYDMFTARPPIRENTDTRPTSFYGTCKVLGEQLCRLYFLQYQLPVISLRPPGIFAGGESLSFWETANLINNMRAGRDHPESIFYAREGRLWEALEAAGNRLCIPYGPGHRSWRWHLVDVRDVVQACLCAMETSHPEAMGKAFNIASPEVQDFSLVVPYLAGRLKRPYLEVELPVCWDATLDFSPARDLLSYRPVHGHKSMIDSAFVREDEP